MEHDESYRDSLSTLDSEGKRKWLYPKKPQGKFYNARTIVSWVLLIFFFAAPFIKINGNQFLQFNILAREFSLFGAMFYPQDFHLFMFAMITAVIAIAIFTLVFGRLFCGWVCPQTIFMEMVFRRIEYWIEGDANEQQALNKQPMSAKKFAKKAFKHAIFFALAFLTSNMFLAYIIGSDELLRIISEPPTQHFVGLLLITLFSFVFYVVFAWVREQVCTNICPYGRLQSVLLDKYSIVVAYDYERGESRAKFRKNEDRAAANKGDCVDCRQCVHVCPTGIDIRNGTQLECVNCTACIDACDSVMDKLGMEKGLIRYASERSIKEKTKSLMTKRNWLFSGILVALSIVFVLLLVWRAPVEATILRTRGQLFQEMPDGRMSNLYNYELYNKTSQSLNMEFRLENVKGTIQTIGEEHLQVGKGGNLKGSMLIFIDKKDLVATGSTPLEIGVYGNGERLDDVKINFLSK